MVSYREHNREDAARRIIASLGQGKDVALITDAGTPGISDPGHYLVGLCVDESLPVVPVPGPSAVTALLSASGMELTRFLFQGFLPPKAGAREEALKELAASGFPGSFFRGFSPPKRGHARKPSRSWLPPVFLS
jgi:16S rRNA (cytidine1402-2'-O)-methyltransferase